MIILQCTNLSKNFGAVKAVNGLNIEIIEGEISSIIGPNGAGKSSLFNIITGLYSPDTGKIEYKGEDITGQPPHSLCIKGLVRTFQKSSIFLNFTCFDHIHSAILPKFGKNFSLWKNSRDLFKEKILNILQTVGLANEAQIPVSSLPHGSKKRLELGLALASEPQLLLLDEPTAGLSAAESKEVVKLIEKINRLKKITILFIEHDMDVVFKISERIRVMHEGNLIMEGNVEDVRNSSEVRRIYFGD